MHTAASSLCDTASLSMRVPLIRSPGADSHVFIDRIYQICNNVHPGMAIETDAVHHIRELLELIITDLLEQRPHTVVEMDRLAQKLFPKGLHSITREAWDMMHNYAPPRKLSKSAAVKQALMIQNKLAILIKENLGFREKEKREREREKDKEIERMAVYILSVCESLTEDILRRTGNYVKNIRNAENKITLHDLKISLNGDRALMELNFKLNNEDEALNESSSPGGFLSNFHDFDPFDGVEGQPPKTPGLTPTSPVAAHFSMPSQVVATYESVANEFLKDERSYLRELNRINIFRRRLESVAGEDTKALLRVLCGNLADIHELTMKVERTLEDAIEMSDAPTVGMGLWDLAEALEFNAYLTYIARETDDSDSEELLSPAIDRIINQILNSPVFASLFGSEDRYDNSSLDGSSFRLTVKYVLPHLLHLPILHFFRYVEYVNRLLRLTSSEDDRDELKNCRVELSKVKSALEQRCQELPDLKANIQASIEALNRNDSPICQVKRLKAIQESIDGFIGDSIAKKCSELIKEGDVHILRPSLTFSPEILRKSGWKTERHIFLFDQLVVMCKKHKTLKFKERLSVQWIDVVDIENDGDLQHAFRLDYRERSTSRSFTITCKTEDEKKQWMEVFVKATTRSVLDRILDNYLKEEEKRIPLVLPSPEQYKFAEPDNEENISFEDYTTSSGIPVIKTGTVVKLVERLTYHQYTDNKFVQTFLISYRSFCTPSELLNMLIERFYVPVPQRLQNQQEMRGGPLAGRYDTVQSHGLSGTNLHSPHSEQSFQRFRKEYERPIQLRVLNVMNQWVKCHWYDFDNDRELLLALQKFLQKSMEPSQKLTNQHRKFCKLILTAIDKRLNQLAEKDKPQDGHVNTAFVYGEEQLNASLNTSLNGSFNGVSTPGPTGIASTPLSAGNSSANRANGTTTNSFQPKKPEVVWHTARKGDFANYDLLTLHPLEIGRQLTLLHFDLYRAIKPIELIGAAWTKHDKYRKSPQLLKLTDHSTLLTYWVSRSIVETESLEERVAMLNRALDVMSVFEELHNFTGLVAFLSALNSSCVHRLSWCWNRLDNEKQKSYDRFVTLCEPRWQEMQKRLQTINPPCVPFFGHYLSSIFFFEAGNSTFVKSPGVKDMKTPESTTVDGQSPTAHNRRVLVSFLKCRRISELIREIQMYQNQPYSLQLEPSVIELMPSDNDSDGPLKPKYRDKGGPVFADVDFRPIGQQILIHHGTRRGCRRYRDGVCKGPRREKSEPDMSYIYEHEGCEPCCSFWCGMTIYTGNKVFCGTSEQEQKRKISAPVRFPSSDCANSSHNHSNHASPSPKDVKVDETFVKVRSFDLPKSKIRDKIVDG